MFQQYCHLNFSGNIPKLWYLDEETEQVMTFSWTGDHLLGYYVSMQVPVHCYKEKYSTNVLNIILSVFKVNNKVTRKTSADFVPLRLLPTEWYEKYVPN